MSDTSQGKPGWRRNDYTREGLAAARDKCQKEYPLNPVGAHMALASYCYSYASGLASGSFIKRLKNLWPFMKLLSEARKNADCARHYASDLKGLSPDQLDVLSSIYRTTYLFRRKLGLNQAAEVMKTEALRCIDEALSQQHVKPHTEALLLCSRGDLCDPKSSEAYRAYEQARMLLSRIIAHGEIEQAGRVARKISEFSQRIGDAYRAEQFRAKAEAFFRQCGATDQLLKMGVKP